MLRNLCLRCGAENLPQFKFCAECGAPLRDSSQSPSLVRPATTSPSQSFGAEYSRQPEEALEGERKTITALFADIKSSMELIENLDPEEAQSIIDPALRVMIEATRRYGGHVMQSTGDGIFATFGAPLAHEEHPQRASMRRLQCKKSSTATPTDCAPRAANRCRHESG